MNLLTESCFQTEIIQESDENGTKKLYISGPFLQADVVNRNRRIYPVQIMDREVNKYIEEFVKPKRAVGELSHPDTPQINLDKITHLTETITKEGNNYIGKAKILNTPCGNIVRGLLEGGVKLGVSSRGMGSVRPNKQGINEVQNDFKLAAIDIVYQPSAPDAFVEGLMENAAYIWDTVQEDVDFVESLRGDIKKASHNQLTEAKIQVFEKFLEKIKSK